MQDNMEVDGLNSAVASDNLTIETKPDASIEQGSLGSFVS